MVMVIWKPSNVGGDRVMEVVFFFDLSKSVSIYRILLYQLTLCAQRVTLRHWLD